ncbi:MAG TPA: protein kinase [Gemmatimonadales bacterium]|jgi:DNA-binding SARP family transcriptional activator
MFRLQTLGGLALTGAAGAPMPLQRRRLALLAIVGAAGEAGVRRDQIVARLWSESPPENARHALEQLLYSIRRQFPPDGVLVGVDPLRLAPGVITSDVQEFESALSREAWGDAAAIYRGPFLDGFYLGDRDFEEWVESERRRLASLHAETLHRLARRAGTEHRHTEAIAWWGKLSALDPLSERSALGLAKALEEAGDAASALREAQRYADRVRGELGVAPTPEHAALVQRLRTGPGSVPVVAPGGGRYRVDREIGRGGVAMVYLGSDLRHGRCVAIKVLRPEVRGSIEADRFLREISIAASLHHPHIVQVYDSGVDAGPGAPPGLYYVMPFVEGETLREMIGRDVQLPVATAIRIAMEVADALGYAHERGIVHRDVKPENILFESGHALLADFGVARALESAGGESLSQSGVVLGTPAYISPEQALGKLVDGRSDLYSLGCVLYEMLAGEPPFTGRTSQTILARHASDQPPPLLTIRPDLPPRLEKIVLRALEKSPESRFRSASLFREALAAL